MAKAKKKGYLTSREWPTGLFIWFATVFLILMLMMSIYQTAITGGVNPATWLMIIFFSIPLLFILGVENNAFPDLSKRKWPSLVVFYFCAMMVIPFAVSSLISFNIAIIIVAIIFGIPLLLSTIHLLTSENTWFDFKAKSKEKLAPKGSIRKKISAKIKSKTKKKKPRKLKRNR